MGARTSGARGGGQNTGLEQFAKDYLQRAKERLLDAEAALRRGSYPEVIRYAQEATELSLKASLRMKGVEYPKVHDVGDVLMLHRPKFEDWFSAEIPWMADFSQLMAAKRSAALYGVEAAGKPPGEIFNDRDEARQCLKKGRRIHEAASRLLRTSRSSG